MRLGRRQANHATVAATRAAGHLGVVAVNATLWWDFQPGQRVMTVDGYPGIVTAVQDGPHPGNEAYEVVLDAGMGGGLYTSGQLSEVAGLTSQQQFANGVADTLEDLGGPSLTRYTAADDYPELGTVLVDRPDIAPNTVLASKVAHSGHEDPDVGPYFDGEKGNHLHGHRDDGATYEPGLGCPYCKWAGFTEDARNEHMYEHHPDSADTGQAEIDQIKRLRGMGSQSDPDVEAMQHGYGDATEWVEDGKPEQREAKTATVRCDECGGLEQYPGQHQEMPALHGTTLKSDSDPRVWMDEHGVSNVPTEATTTSEHPQWPYLDTTRFTFTPKPDRRVYTDEDHLVDDFRALKPSLNSKQAGSTWTGAEEPDGDWSPGNEHDYADSFLCPKCGGRRALVSEDGIKTCQVCGYSTAGKTSAFDPYTMVAEAATDSDFRFHVTASWADVRRKAKRLRTEGKVRLTSVHGFVISAEVKGDHHVYETEVQHSPGNYSAVAMWHCGCKWGSYSWGRSGQWRRYEGRMCSHALATQYEAMSRGAYGHPVEDDQKSPAWLKPRTRVVVEYDRTEQKNVSRPAVPRKRDVNRRYKAASKMVPALSPVDFLMSEASSAGEDMAEVEVLMRTAGIRTRKTAAANDFMGDGADEDVLNGDPATVHSRPLHKSGPSENPGSTGWASGADPEDWGSSSGFGRMGVSDATLHDEPEPALPETDGADDDAEDDTLETNQFTGSAESVLEQFQRNASHLNPGGGSGNGTGNSDIAQAAREALAKMGMKDFTPAEQAAIINEGEGITASNLDRLNIEGTHYEALEAALAMADTEDEGWLE